MKAKKNRSTTETIKNLPDLVKDDSYLQPFAQQIIDRQKYAKKVEKNLLQGKRKLSNFANGHNFFGLHRQKDGWIFREWAPNATKVFLRGEFSNWQDKDEFALSLIDENGIWQIELAADLIHHLDYYKLHIFWQGGSGERIPSYANYVVQDKETNQFCARVWAPSKKYRFKNSSPRQKDQAPIIYEAHVGMGLVDEKVGSYDEFRENVLPRIVKGGYNTLQLMAIQEHPYYGSFGYQVSNFFAPSSRSGTPEELKRLIDEAHGMGLSVIMDIVHSHAVKNELEGLGKFDGTQYQYFHAGEKGLHPAWDTMCFDYSKGQVLHFLLSNCKYWLEEFNFDGFRFDGVTSMLYDHHGLGKSFSSYDDYFTDDVDEDALAYFYLANKLIHQIKPEGLSIAEDMSGMPGLAFPIEKGGLGFDMRLAMGIPDYWIKLLKESSDENWRVGSIWHELTNRRKDERVVSYAESHDQALVGDKTIIFWLLDKDIYFNMSLDKRNHIIDRGLALHKMIRLITIATARGAYLNFMGNEFGHPEWIDFPREGNDWSYKYARRQWNLRDDEKLCYRSLAEFDRQMVQLIKDHDLLSISDPNFEFIHEDDQILIFSRKDLLFVFNFHPSQSQDCYKFDISGNSYQQIFSSDDEEFAGFSRIKNGEKHYVVKGRISLYIPSRTAMVLQRC